MYNPLVSIIIPEYNGSDYLKDCIESALAQTYNNIEVIVVNDGSCDDGKTQKIALGFGDKIRYYYKENGGVSSALNLGIEKMNGDWFSWLSHDDLYLPDKIQAQIREIDRSGADKKTTIFSCLPMLIDVNGKEIFTLKRRVYRVCNRIIKARSGFFPGKRMFIRILKNYSINGCTLLIPKYVFEKEGGFDEKYKYIQDWVYWLELFINDYNYYIYRHRLIKSRVHPEQQTRKIAYMLHTETHDYLKRLLIGLQESVKKNEFYLKNILLYTIRINNLELIRNYKIVLRENNLFNVGFFIRYIYNRITGKVIRVIKTVYRRYMNFKYRT